VNKLSSATMLAFLAFSAVAPLAHADDRRERGDRSDFDRERHERGELRRERYDTPHWRYDDRFHHDRYYPQLGYRVTVLPPARVEIRFRGEPFFFHSGVWYRPVGPSFVVVRPPVGIVVAALPVGYSTVVVGGAPYYYANDAYYVQRPDGYAVVDAPPGYAEMEAPAAPPAPRAPAPAATAPAAATGTWYYCESAKAYYPYVSECREGWRPVAATPPR
jgi:uncharacterized protein DUF6515